MIASVGNNGRVRALRRVFFRRLPRARHETPFGLSADLAVVGRAIGGFGICGCLTLIVVATMGAELDADESTDQKRAAIAASLFTSPHLNLQNDVLATVAGWRTEPPSPPRPPSECVPANEDRDDESDVVVQVVSSVVAAAPVPVQDFFTSAAWSLACALGFGHAELGKRQLVAAVDLLASVTGRTDRATAALRSGFETVHACKPVVLSFPQRHLLRVLGRWAASAKWLSDRTGSGKPPCVSSSGSFSTTTIPGLKASKFLRSRASSAFCLSAAAATTAQRAAGMLAAGAADNPSEFSTQPCAFVGDGAAAVETLTSFAAAAGRGHRRGRGSDPAHPIATRVLTRGELVNAYHGTVTSASQHGDVLMAGRIDGVLDVLLAASGASDHDAGVAQAAVILALAFGEAAVADVGRGGVVDDDLQLERDGVRLAVVVAWLVHAALDEAGLRFATIGGGHGGSGWRGRRAEFVSIVQRLAFAVLCSESRSGAVSALCTLQELSTVDDDDDNDDNDDNGDDNSDDDGSHANNIGTLRSAAAAAFKALARRIGAGVGGGGDVESDGGSRFASSCRRALRATVTAYAAKDKAVARTFACALGRRAAAAVACLSTVPTGTHVLSPLAQLELFAAEAATRAAHAPPGEAGSRSSHSSPESTPSESATPVPSDIGASALHDATTKVAAAIILSVTSASTHADDLLIGGTLSNVCAAATRDHRGVHTHHLLRAVAALRHNDVASTPLPASVRLNSLEHALLTRTAAVVGGAMAASAAAAAGEFETPADGVTGVGRALNRCGCALTPQSLALHGAPALPPPAHLGTCSFFALHLVQIERLNGFEHGLGITLGIFDDARLLAARLPHASKCPMISAIRRRRGGRFLISNPLRRTHLSSLTTNGAEVAVHVLNPWTTRASRSGFVAEGLAGVRRYATHDVFASVSTVRDLPRSALRSAKRRVGKGGCGVVQSTSSLPSVWRSVMAGGGRRRARVLAVDPGVSSGYLTGVGFAVECGPEEQVYTI